MSLKARFRGWLCRTFGHSWVETRLNLYCITTEQTCRRCGTKRHHMFDYGWDDWEPRWRDGPHPGEKAAA